MADRQADLIIVGGGPAGMMAGLLFARAGVRTLVIEKHKDFLRDFRGDTVHPSTMEILEELALLQRFLERPHNCLSHARLRIAGQEWTIGDLSHLATPAPFIAMMPQWDFLDFLRDEAELYPGFALEMGRPVESFIEEDGRVAGVVSGGERIRSRLVIAADGRSSLVRTLGLLPVDTLAVPMDVFWFRLPKANDGGEALRGSAEAGRIVVLIDRGDYWQVAMVIPKGGAEAIRAKGIEAVREVVEQAWPALDLRSDSIGSFDDVHLLSVALDRLTRWHRPGLLAIGDAAHAMSPIGGIGINLAIQDSVAAANILAGPLAEGREVDPLLAKVQARRLFPTRAIQGAQKLAQDRVIGRLLTAQRPLAKAPLVVRLLNRFPVLRRIPGRFIGLGIRRERVRSPDAGLRRAGLPSPSPSRD